MGQHNDPIRFVVLKFISALGILFSIELWTTAGKLAAAGYSIAIFGEWVWKKIIKPAAKRRGWVEPTRAGDL